MKIHFLLLSAEHSTFFAGLLSAAVDGIITVGKMFPAALGGGEQFTCPCSTTGQALIEDDKVKKKQKGKEQNEQKN